MQAHSIHRQRGAALLIAMVMIFMLSIMGISAMRTSTLEKQMATNAIQSTTTLQAAESATEQMLNDRQLLGQVSQVIDRVVEVDTTPAQAGLGIVNTAEIAYVGKGLAYGFSASKFSTLRYVAQGDSRIESARSRSIIRQGANQLVPNN